MEDGAALGRHVGAAALPLLGGRALHEVGEVPVLALDVDAQVGLETRADDPGERSQEGG